MVPDSMFASKAGRICEPPVSELRRAKGRCGASQMMPFTVRDQLESLCLVEE